MAISTIAVVLKPVTKIRIHEFLEGIYRVDNGLLFAPVLPFLFARAGFVYLPALLGIVATSVLFAPLGARLAHRLPVPVLKRFFAIFLLVLGIRMMFGL